MQLVKAIASGLIALIACAVLLAYTISYFDSTYQPINSFGLTASGLVTLSFSVIAGTPFIVFFGAPAFTLLVRYNRAKWLYVLLLGALPGLIALPFNWGLGLVFIAFGIPISAFVRLVCGAGPNNSFKPTPLRGAA